jgi:site-specific recombinase XerD
MKASISFYANLAKKNELTGLIPIYLRICFRRNKVENRLNASIHESDIGRWDPITQKLRERNSPINLYLSSFEKKFTDFLMLQPDELQRQSASSLRDLVLGYSKNNKPTLVEFVDKYFKSTILSNVNAAPGTIKNYRKSLNHLKAFVTFEGLSNKLVEHVDFEFASRFKNYLVSSNLLTGRKGMNEVSAAGIIKKMRTIFSHATECGYTNNNPFKRVKIKTKSSPRERLSIEQVATLSGIDLKQSPQLEIYRDLFLFSVFTGLAYQDAMGLSEGDIENRKDGECRLKLYRHKTGVVTESFLSSNATDIIDKYGKSLERKNSKKLLPQRSNQKINQNLKALAGRLGISFLMTTHIARHTFRQLLAEAGVTDMAVIKRMMGQTRGGDIDAIYYQVTERGLLKAKDKFQLLWLARRFYLFYRREGQESTY